MKVGFSLSPGGLLLPYHMGALHCLEQSKVLDDDSMVAGSSAGSIAAMAHGCRISPFAALEGTIAISDRCATLGGARGRLKGLLREQMERLVGEDEFDVLRQSQQRRARASNIGIAYQQVFPTRQSYLQTSFVSRDDLLRAVTFSCAFPFFTSNWPWVADETSPSPLLPRLMVDGFFSVPREQFGCPFLHNTTDADVMDRTVSVCCLPREVVGLTGFAQEDCISPPIENDDGPFSTADLVRIATQPSSRRELTDLFELGYRNAEEWCWDEAKRLRQVQVGERKE